MSSFKKEEKFKVNDTSLKPIEDEIKWLWRELGDIQLDGIKKQHLEESKMKKQLKVLSEKID